MQLSNPIVLPALLAVLATTGFAQSQSTQAPAQTTPTPSGPESVRFNVTVPEGATKVSWKVWDDDSWFYGGDDLLGEGCVDVPKEPGGDRPLEIDPKLRCEDGHVRGDKDTSGEAEAEIFLEVTFTYPGGATETVRVPRQRQQDRQVQVSVGRILT